MVVFNKIAMPKSQEPNIKEATLVLWHLVANLMLTEIVICFLHYQGKNFQLLLVQLFWRIAFL